jgi:uncharacterized protein YraI
MLTILLAIILLLGLSVSPPLQAQDPVPTPINPAAMQTSSNLGRSQPLRLPDMLAYTGVSTWQDADYTGRNIRVGVIDQGFGALSRLEAANEIQINLAPGMDRAEADQSVVTHGTDVLAIIHVIAPGADLYACAYTLFADYRRCIDWMIATEVQIVNHSAGVPALPLDGSNPWAREVDRMARAGALWINAAGNFAGGFLRDTFADTNYDTYHEFRATGIVQALELAALGPVEGRILLSWEGLDDVPANSIDLDLHVTDELGAPVASSTATQRGDLGDEALEIVRVQMDRPLHIRIRSPQPYDDVIRFVLYVEFNEIPTGQTAGSIIAPGDSLNALTVGALQGTEVAPYSSRGPLVTGAIKPDVVAPGEVILPDGRSFVGTSAAAAVATGISALLWEIRPEMSRQEIFDFIREEMAIDDSILPGPDNTHGFGSLYVRPPEVLAPPDPGITGAPQPRTEFVCDGALAPRLVVGMSGIVSNYDGSKVNVRSGAGIDNARLTQLEPMQTFIVDQGPVCADGFVWYQIDFGNGIGWIAEGIRDDTGQEYYFVQPMGQQPAQNALEPTDIICNISIYEDFSRGARQRWFIGSGAQSSVHIGNGAYELQLLDDTLDRQPVSWGSLQEIEFTNDLHVRAEISAQTFSNDDDRTGLWLNYLSSNEYKAFMIRSDGYFTITDFDFGYTPVIDWRPSSAIATGDGAVNVLDIVRRDGNYEFAINGVFVTNAPTDEQPSGRIAFFGASHTVPTTFRLNSIRICAT